MSNCLSKEVYDPCLECKEIIKIIYDVLLQICDRLADVVSPLDTSLVTSIKEITALANKYPWLHEVGKKWDDPVR